MDKGGQITEEKMILETLSSVNFYTYLALGAYVIVAINFTKGGQPRASALFSLAVLLYASLHFTEIAASKAGQLAPLWSIFNLMVAGFLLYLSNNRKHG